MSGDLFIPGAPSKPAAQTTSVQSTQSFDVGSAIGNVFKDPNVVGSLAGAAGSIVNSLLGAAGKPSEQVRAEQAAAEAAAAKAKTTTMLIIGGAVAGVILIVIVVAVRK